MNVKLDLNNTFGLVDKLVDDMTDSDMDYMMKQTQKFVDTYKTDIDALRSKTNDFEVGIMNTQEICITDIIKNSYKPNK